MAIREILRYPDPRLTLRAAPVTVFDEALAALVADLTETMQAAPGVGITAPHIGVPLAVTVIALDPAAERRVYVNPQVIATGPGTIRHVEGSVSMPGFTDEVERARPVTIRFQRLDGTQAEETADGFMASCLQHEIDQINGIFWINRLSRLRRDRLVKRALKSSRG